MDAPQFNEFVNQDFDSCSNWLFSLNPYEFSAIAVIMGLIISPALTVNQQNSLGNFLELLGQVILTINAQNVTIKFQTKHSSIKPHIER